MRLTVSHALTILAVEHLHDSVEFYRAAFPWDIAVETPVYVEFSLPEGARIGLYEREAFAHNTGRVPAKIADGELAPTELYFYTDGIDAAMQRLHTAGARTLSPLAPRPWGDDAAYFADPNGNVLVLARAHR